MPYRGQVAHQSKQARVFVKNDGGDWIRIPGIATILADGGEAGEEDVVMLEGTLQFTTTPPVPSISIDVPSAQFLHQSMDILADAYTNEEDRVFRFETLAAGTPVENDAAARIKIDNAGAFELSTPGSVKLLTGPVGGNIGYVADIGGTPYWIDDILTETTGTVYPVPAAPVGGAQGIAFTIRTPRLRLDDVVCAVRNAPPGNWNIGQQRSMGAAIGLSPKSALAKFKAVLD